MILAALSDYYRRLLDRGARDIALPGYSREKISYAVLLSPTGSVVDIHDIRDVSGKKPVPRTLSVPQPKKRAVDITPNFLWDKTSYALGVSGSSKRVVKEHESFRALHRERLKDETDPGIRAFLKFLDDWTPERFQSSPFHPQMRDTNIVFRIDGQKGYLHDLPAAKLALTKTHQGKSQVGDGMCLVSGQASPIARLHPAIKGVYGAQSAGASIVSFNLESFTSFGKSQGDNAPISEQTAFEYTTALNHLLRRDPHNRQRLQIGDTSVVFWACASGTQQEESAENLLSSFLGLGSDDGQETQKLRSVLEAVSAGRPLQDLDPALEKGTRIFILGLAPNISRLSIRFWQSDTLEKLIDRLAQHFRDLALEPLPWRRPPEVWRLLLATAPTRNGKAKSEDIAPHLAGELTRAIITGTRYPRSVLGNLIMRMRADGDVSGIRVALCKAVLARDKRLGVKGIKEEIPVSLDRANEDPGYLLGRLFSVIENIQKSALGKQLNAPVRDRYYGAASATPANVFPVLLRSSQHHLGRLRKDKPGLAVNLEKDVGEIIDLLGPSFPRSLRIEAQGHFAIGYYHQTHAHFSRSGARSTDESDFD